MGIYKAMLGVTLWNIFILLIMYAIGSFAFLEMNILQWSDFARGGIAFGIISFNILIGISYIKWFIDNN